MGKGKSVALVVGVPALCVFVAVFSFAALTGQLQIPSYQASTVNDGTIVDEAQYSPYVISSWHFTVMNALDPDSAYGANDVYGRVYPEGEFDFNDAPLETETTYSTSGAITFNDSKVKSSTKGGEDNKYEVLFYQGDGGTNLYADLDTYGIPAFPDSVSTWVEDQAVFLTTEGVYKDLAFDNMEGNGSGIVVTAWDESGDTCTLDKSDEIVQGTVVWDFTLGNNVSGSCLKEPVLTIFEDDSDPFTDIDDIEHLYISVKTGTGVTFPSRDLVTDFKNANDIEITDDDCLGSSDSITGTLTLELPSAEASVGTGSLKVCFDDLGSYSARDLDKDKRATAECTTITIQE